MRKVRNANAEHQASLSPIERACKRIADATGAPIALALAILVQAIWIVAGSLLKWDPFPFVFLLTASNVLQLCLIFVIAVAQRQSSEHAETRAEIDHEHISRILDGQDDILEAVNRAGHSARQAAEHARKASGSA